jgi:thioredoxin reductase
VAVEGDTVARRLVVRGPDGAERVLDVDAVFVELGLRPHSELVEGLANVDEQGRVVVNCGTETGVPGLFAAGDVTNLPSEQVLIAIGEGAKAALAAYEYLMKLEG